MGLREETAEKHRIAEQKEFNQRMFRGELTKEEYVNYLTQQSLIFNQIEFGNNLPSDSLRRSEKITEDLKELKEQENYIVLPSTIEYVNYISNLTEEQLLPHIYLNYLALAYGGQMMKSKVPGSGRMYDFDNMMECVGSIRAVQKDEWSEEVNKGFDFLIDIFDGLQNTTRPNGK
jgi:heme oxygenase